MIIKVLRKASDEIITVQLVNVPSTVRNTREWLEGAVDGVLDTLRISTHENRHYLTHLGRIRDEVYVTVE